MKLHNKSLLSSGTVAKATPRARRLKVDWQPGGAREQSRSLWAELLLCRFGIKPAIPASMIPTPIPAHLYDSDSDSSHLSYDSDSESDSNTIFMNDSDSDSASYSIPTGTLLNTLILTPELLNINSDLNTSPGVIIYYTIRIYIILIYIK